MDSQLKKERWSIKGLQALIFDLDGVVTQSASLHMKAWEKMFKEYLNRYHLKTHKEFQPYMVEKDYLQYIDGKPRYDGVQSFLKSRNISIPYGSPSDDPDKETVCGLGNHKNKIFLELLQNEGVKVFDEAVHKIKIWRQQGLKTAIISSSKNCKTILERANIADLFDIRIDGVTSEELNIPGKPAPDIFLKAAEQLQTNPSDAAIFEDSLAGVKAGKAGNFRFVVGIARHSSVQDLYKNGANIVIKNFKELE